MFCFDLIVNKGFDFNSFIIQSDHVALDYLVYTSLVVLINIMLLFFCCVVITNENLKLLKIIFGNLNKAVKTIHIR